MSRDFLLYLEDMREALDRITRYTHGLTLEAFAADEIRVDAVVRNLELLGEAVKHLPEDVRAQAPHIPWRQIAGLRDILAHAYFSVNLVIVWDIVTNEADPLRQVVQNLIQSLASNPPTDPSPPDA
jgi:uncharacterized protein with HEPN domain